MYISPRRSVLVRRRPSLGDTITDLINNIPFVSDITGDTIDFDASTDPSVLTTADGSTVSASDFNCTKVPGVCKPMNVPALSAVQALQTNLDRVADVKGYGKIAVDGDVGPGTIALLNQVAAGASGGVQGAASPLALVGAGLEGVNAQVVIWAQNLNAPAVVSTPAAGKPATLATKSGQNMKAPAPNQAAAGGNLGALGTTFSGTTLMVAGGAIAAFMFLGKPSRSSSKRRTTKRRRRY